MKASGGHAERIAENARRTWDMGVHICQLQRKSAEPTSRSSLIYSDAVREVPILMDKILSEYADQVLEVARLRRNGAPGR